MLTLWLASAWACGDEIHCFKIHLQAMEEENHSYPCSSLLAPRKLRAKLATRKKLNLETNNVKLTTSSEKLCERPERLKKA